MSAVKDPQRLELYLAVEGTTVCNVFLGEFGVHYRRQAVIRRVKLDLLPKRSAICAILFREQGIGGDIAASYLSGLNVPSVSEQYHQQR